MAETEDKSKDKISKNYLIFKDILSNLNKNATIVTKDFKPDESEVLEGFKSREKSYTNLMEHFVDNYYKTHAQKRRLKQIFFWFIMPLYAIIILASLFAIIFSFFTEGSQLAIILGSVATIITSVIAIPTIIAKYLFPTNEDMDMTNMISEMQNYDNGIRQIEDRKNETD